MGSSPRQGTHLWSFVHNCRDVHGPKTKSLCPRRSFVLPATHALGTHPLSARRSIWPSQLCPSVPRNAGGLISPVGWDPFLLTLLMLRKRPHHLHLYLMPVKPEVLKPSGSRANTWPQMQTSRFLWHAREEDQPGRASERPVSPLTLSQLYGPFGVSSGVWRAMWTSQFLANMLEPSPERGCLFLCRSSQFLPVFLLPDSGPVRREARGRTALGSRPVVLNLDGFAPGHV